MANYDKVTKSMFLAVKTLLKGGASPKEAAEYMKLSTVTVYRIKETENYDEYEQAKAERQAKRRAVAAMKAKENNRRLLYKEE